MVERFTPTQRTALIELRDVTRENWVACAKLSLKSEQEGLVAANVYTIAQSKFEPHHRIRAIYHDDTPVGLLAYCHEDEPVDDFELYWLFRLMIDREHQGQGYGTEAVRLVIEEVTQLGAKRLRTMHRPTNQAAPAIYRKLGFQEIGSLDDGDTLLELNLAEPIPQTP